MASDSSDQVFIKICQREPYQTKCRSKVTYGSPEVNYPILNVRVWPVMHLTKFHQHTPKRTLSNKNVGQMSHRSHQRSTTPHSMSRVWPVIFVTKIHQHTPKITLSNKNVGQRSYRGHQRSTTPYCMVEYGQTFFWPSLVNIHPEPYQIKCRSKVTIGFTRGQLPHTLR